MTSIPGSAGSRLRHRFKPGTSGTLVVVYSQVRVPDGKFGLERLFSDTRHACLFLNDPQNGWYLGLHDEINRQLDAAVGEARPDRIIHYGSSMGAVAALGIGLVRSDGAIHAFGGELLPGTPDSQGRQYGVRPNEPNYPDFRTLGSSPPAHPVHLYYGCFDGTDAANAAIAMDWFPHATLHLLASTHASHDHLYSLNIIRRIIRTFDRDPAPELRSKELYAAFDRESLQRYGNFVERRADGPLPTPDEVQSEPDYTNNPGLQLLHAEMLARHGNPEAAAQELAELEERVSAHPLWRSLPKRWRRLMPLRRTALLLDIGNSTEAGRVFDTMRARFPLDEPMEDLARRLGIASG